MDLYDILQNHIGIFLLILTRVSGIFIMAPFFGSKNTPAKILEEDDDLADEDDEDDEDDVDLFGEDEVRAELEDAGLDPDDYDF